MIERLKQQLAMLLLVALAGAAAVAFSYKAYRGFYVAGVASGWPQASAVVIDRSKVDEVFDRQPRATATVRYRYAVDGEEYEGIEQREFAAIAEADELLHGYPVGREFSIYYNPTDPAESVIDVTLSAETFLHLAIGVLAMIGMVTMLWSVIGSCIRGGSEPASE